ncbi:YolD-like family protein [Bacillus sp. CGMCC 1.16607]|uniref:YolD-like family protein n=1 Tax=Bacillus sp. CGMCC 1.16607 TaxID=3351842 RepID=UPI0036386480
MIKDRGAMKWNGFFMPEQTLILKQIKKDESKLNKPELDEQELEEIELAVLDSLYNGTVVKLRLWEYGMFFNLTGTVLKVDTLDKKITLRTDIEDKIITIDKITMVTRL